MNADEILQMNGEEVLRRAKHVQWLIIAGVATAVLLIAGLLLLAWHTRQVDERRAAEQRTAICEAVETLKTIQRNDIERSIRANRDLLEQNPHGIPGFPRGVIEQSIANKEQTLRELAPIACE